MADKDKAIKEALKTARGAVNSKDFRTALRAIEVTPSLLQRIHRVSNCLCPSWCLPLSCRVDAVLPVCVIQPASRVLPPPSRC
jgi:hypothetical protein